MENPEGDSKLCEGTVRLILRNNPIRVWSLEPLNARIKVDKSNKHSNEH